MYTTEIDNLDCTELHKMMFMWNYLVTCFTGSPPPICSTCSTWSQLPCSNIYSCGRICSRCKDPAGLWVCRALYHELLFSFLTKPYDSVFISMLASTAIVDNMLFGYVFLHWLSWRGSLEVYFKNNSIKLSKSNTLGSVIGLRHFTRNVSAICTILSVSAELLKL